MKQNTKNKVKGGLLTLLIALGAAKGFSEEKNGTVIMKRYSTPDDYGDITASVFMDTDGDRLPDTILYIYMSNKLMFSMLLDEYIQRGSEVLFNDAEAKKSGGLSGVGTIDLISIDGLSVFDIFPDAPDTWFPYVRRANSQGR